MGPLYGKFPTLFPLTIPSLKLTANAPENGGPLGKEIPIGFTTIFGCENVSFREGRWIFFSQNITIAQHHCGASAASREVPPEVSECVKRSNTQQRNVCEKNTAMFGGLNQPI